MQTDMRKCEHCHTEIRDQSSMVQKNGKTYCCNNCAMATDQRM